MAAKHFAEGVSPSWFEDDPLAGIPLRFGRHFKEPEPASVTLETFTAQTDDPSEAVRRYIEQLTAELEYQSRRSPARGRHASETADEHARQEQGASQETENADEAQMPQTEASVAEDSTEPEAPLPESGPSLQAILNSVPMIEMEPEQKPEPVREQMPDEQEPEPEPEQEPAHTPEQEPEPKPTPIPEVEQSSSIEDSVDAVPEPAEYEPAPARVKEPVEKPTEKPVEVLVEEHIEEPAEEPTPEPEEEPETDSTARLSMEAIEERAADFTEALAEEESLEEPEDAPAAESVAEPMEGPEPKPEPAKELAEEPSRKSRVEPDLVEEPLSSERVGSVGGRHDLPTPNPPDVASDVDESDTDELEDTAKLMRVQIPLERLVNQHQEQRIRASTKLPERDAPKTSSTAIEKRRSLGFFARIGGFVARILHLDDR